MKILEAVWTKWAKESGFKAWHEKNIKGNFYYFLKTRQMRPALLTILFISIIKGNSLEAGQPAAGYVFDMPALKGKDIDAVQRPWGSQAKN